MSDLSIRLDLIAAKARQLSEDVERGRLWPGELSKGLADIRTQLEHAEQSARTDR